MKQTSTQACVRDSNGKPAAAQHWRKCSAKRPIFIPKLQTDTSHRSCAARTCNGWPDPTGARPIIIKPKRSKWQGLLRAVDAILLILQPIMQERPACFIDFPREVGAEELPQRFNFPFYYEPHPLCLEAAAHLQQYLRESLRGQENGKMFGVLLVQDEHGRLGYLRAFSGKLAGTNQWPGFVPPIFDLLNPDGFYRKGEAEINEINARIAAMEQSPELTAAMNALAQVQKEQEQELKSFKELIKTNKAKR